MPSMKILSILVLLAPLVAQAADLPVRYTVDEKQLKNAISGTNLTFEIYSDATCTTLADSTVVTIDNVGIRERIKQFKPRSGAVQLKVVELHQTFLGVTATGNLFLKVTGTGVVPVGGACQAQAAAVAGGGGDGSGAVVKDGLGTVMGQSLDGLSFLIQVGPDLVQLAVTSTDYVPSGELYYDTLGCTGVAYDYPRPAPATLFVEGYPINGTQFFVQTSGGALTATASQLATSRHVSNQTDCDNYIGGGTFVAPHSCCLSPQNFNVNLSPVTLLTLPAFTPPFTLDLP